MTRYRFILGIMALFVCILACTGPAKSETPRHVSTVDIEHITPIPEVDAVAAIKTFAQVVLGIRLPELKAGGSMGEMNLPITTRDGEAVDFDIAGETYLGFWKGGFGSLSIGDSSISGDWVADVEDGCLGAYVVFLDQGIPVDAQSALNHVFETFPGLVGYDFVEDQMEEFNIKGYSFIARQVDDIHIQPWEAELTGTIIRAGVAPGMLEGRSATWVVVASGVLASPFRAQP